MKAFSALLTLTTALAVSNGHVAITKTPNELHPVHELYVKPSADGTTGDLYVAATEESGSKTQWLTDQPVHFLPSMQSQPALPTSYAEESLNTKRSVVNPHPQQQYPYALPATGRTEANAVPSYPYVLPASSPTPATEVKTEAPTTAAAAIPQYNPYQYFYPQIMAAYANMLNVLKDAGMSEESAASAVTQGSSMWPHSYAYPVQYVMVDPSMWAQAQATTTTSASPTPAAADKE